MAKRIATNQERYGANHFLETEAFAEKSKATSQEHYGTDHPMGSQEVRDRLSATLSEKYRQPVRSCFGVKEVQERAYASSVANHGGVHHLSDPDVIEARKKHLLEVYGVDNISKVPAVKERIIARLKERFRDGAIPSITTPERAFRDIVPERVVYSGDFSYWVTWANGRHKNPDFVVLTKEQYAAYQAGVPLGDLRTHLVVEVNGVFWHTKHKNLTREEREAEFIDGYASVGVTCLVVWEDDLKADPQDIRSRVEDFLAQSKPPRV
jgi:G:T-mismatch repair DNA endonuclease (very short patch repair protein)